MQAVRVCGARVHRCGSVWLAGTETINGEHPLTPVDLMLRSRINRRHWLAHSPLKLLGRLFCNFLWALLGARQPLALHDGRMEISGRAALVLLVAWYGLLVAAGLHIFASGFLLRRAALLDRSVCAVSPDPRHGGPGISGGHSCWMPARYSKAVVVVVDALRYDFALYDEGLASEAAAASSASVPPFRNHMREMHRSVSRLLADSSPK